MAELPDLRDHVRDEQVPPGVVVIRGGPDSAAKLVAHAQRTARAFVLDGRPVLGISAFAVLDDVGPSSLSRILLRMSTYRVVHVVDAARLIEAGFGVLPTFERPHVTITLGAPREVGALVALFGEGEPNPRYGELVHRARRHPQ